MERARCLQLVLTLVLFLAETSSGYEGSPKNDREQAIQHLNVAIMFYQRADVLPMQSEACEAAIKDALIVLDKARSVAAVQDWKFVKKAVGTARNENAGCINKLRPDSTPLGRALSYLILQAERKLAIVDDKLGNKSPAAPVLATRKPKRGRHKDDKPKPVGSVVPSKGCPQAAVDGTRCQYSACGQGLGLVSCAIGFAKGVVGGLFGNKYVVTNDADNPLEPPEGSLRYGTNLARNTLGIWITFSRNMIIELKEMLWIQSHTTIDGRNFNVTITKRNIVVGDVRDVIIHNIQVNSIAGSDSIHIFAGSFKVWIDHVTSFSAQLGLVSVLQGATDVTISNCRLQNDNFNMLLGASDADIQDKAMRVTVYRNWFYDSTQRMPHCRWGTFHVANNLYTNWGYYAIGGRVNARVKSEKNAFISARTREVTPWFEGFNSDTFDNTARIESHSDLLLNGTTFHQFLLSPLSVARVYEDASKVPPLVPAQQVPLLVKPCAGALLPSASCLRW